MAEPVEIVSNDCTEIGPVTPGMSRATAFAKDHVWVGEVRTDAEVASGWHHHGDHATYGRVLEGTVRVEFGERGANVLDAGPGDFFFVPPRTVHRESNPGEMEHVLMVVRLGSGPTVFNVEGPETS